MSSKKYYSAPPTYYGGNRPTPNDALINQSDEKTDLPRLPVKYTTGQKIFVGLFFFLICCFVVIITMLLAVDWNKPWLEEYWNIQVSPGDLKWYNESTKIHQIKYQVGGQRIKIYPGTYYWIFSQTVYTSPGAIDKQIGPSVLIVKTNETSGAVTESYFLTDQNGGLRQVIGYDTNLNDTIIPSGAIMINQSILQFWTSYGHQNASYAGEVDALILLNQTSSTFSQYYPSSFRPQVSLLIDNYIYYYISRGSLADIVLARSGSEFNISYPIYEFYNGTNNKGAPQFISSIDKTIVPVVTNATSQFDVEYNPKLECYLMLSANNDSLYLRTSKYPWGPWSVPSLVYLDSTSSKPMYYSYFHSELSNSTGEAMFVSYCREDMLPKFLQFSFFKR